MANQKENMKVGAEGGSLAPVVDTSMTSASARSFRTIEDAIALALKVHAGATDKAGQPYILHPLRLMSRMQSMPERMAAVLHDVVEDDTRYGTTFESLRRDGYDEEVVAALECLTRRSDESYETFVRRAAANPIAARVKLADLEDNMDVRRLGSVGAKEVERLERYRRAWHELSVSIRERESGSR